MGYEAEKFVPERARSAVKREARLMIALHAGLAAGSVAIRSGALVWAWLLPALVGQPFLRLNLLAEHGRCAFVSNMLENSRTTFTNRLVRWIAWNMPYHAEHHAYPVAPLHTLPAFHAVTRAHLRETEAGYARFTARYVSEVVVASARTQGNR